MAVYQDIYWEMLDFGSVALLAVAAYNTLELLFWIFDFFKRWSGLYFWSTLIGTLSIGTFTVVATISTFRDVSLLATSICNALTYPCMHVAASLVLYSRLHLITQGKILTFTRWLIIVSSVGLYIPHITIMIGFSAYSSSDNRFYRAREVDEYLVIGGSMGRELFICGVYIYESVKQLKPIMIMKGRAGRKVMVHLILVNVAVALLDVLLWLLLHFQAQHLDRKQSKYYGVGIGMPYNCASQSVKLKIEFGILNKLLHLLGAPADSVEYRRSPGQSNEQSGSEVPMMRETASVGMGSSSPGA